VTAATGAEGVRWDLSPLAPSEEAMKARTDAAVADAAAFVDRWPAETIQAVEPEALAELLREVAGLRSARSEAAEWSFLLQWSQGDDPATADIAAWVDERLPRLDEAIRHFELAWMAVPDDRARALAGDGQVAADRHYLLAVRRFAPFMLSPAEERVLAARDASANGAWRSLRDRTLGALATDFDDGTGEREWSLSELESTRRTHRDREVRRRAAVATRALVEPALPVLAQCYDAVVADRLSIDHLRGHDDPMAARNLENEIDAEVVEQLLTSAEAHRELGTRWFAAKARMLGVDRIETFDLAAAAVEAPPLAWDEGRRLVVEVFESLTPELGAEAERFFAEQRVDAEIRRGKPFGAFCVQASTRTPGFALVNWSGELGDLVTLGHELGHGLHFALAGHAQTDNSFKSGLTVSEIPSTFAELLLVDRLLEAGSELGRAALARELDQMVIVAFWATALARFEQRTYAVRADGQALTAERLSDLCAAVTGEGLADAVADEAGVFPINWALLPHFVHERFYMYAYVFALLVAAGLVRRAREPGFGERYAEFLARGGSGSPEELLAILDVDLGGPGIWDDGFALLAGWLDTIEQSAG
jgi:oligoendopeptidase F